MLRYRVNIIILELFISQSVVLRQKKEISKLWQESQEIGKKIQFSLFLINLFLFLIL